MSELYQSLSHSKWDCKYHVILVPKRRRKLIFGQARRQLGAIFHALARQKECQKLSSNARPCAYGYCHSSQAPGGLGDRVSPREECDCHRSPERQRTKLRDRFAPSSHKRSQT